MAEALGIASSLIALVQLVKTCVDMYDMISDGKHASKDLDQLVAALQIERVKFLLWCQSVGFNDLLILREQRPPGFNLESQTAEKMKPYVEMRWILQVIEKTMLQISHTFKESDDLLSAYTHSARVSTISKLSQLSERVRVIDKATSQGEVGELISFDEAMLSATQEGPKRSMSTLQSMQWALKDKKRFKSLVKTLAVFNRGLEDVITLVEKNKARSMKRQIELLATTTSVADLVATLPDPQDSSDAENLSNSSLRNLVTLYRRGISITKDDEDDRDHDNAEGSGAIFETSLDLYILSTDVELPPMQDKRPSTRFLTSYKSKPAIVEWKYYSRQISPDVLAHLRRRVQLLTMQLQLSSQTPGFSVLNCLGHFNDDLNNRVGIVFEAPSSPGPLQMISLRDRIIDDRKFRVIRDLCARMEIARILTTTYFRLHSVGWLHKSFRSENVLLFENKDRGSHELDTPFVCGFDFSRQDSLTELTEDVPSALIERHQDHELGLYRHPDLQAHGPARATDDTDHEPHEVNGFRFRTDYDLYSLGIVLLEIGLWYPIKSLCGRKETVEDFQARLNSDIVPELRYRMGKRYYEVVMRCLTGSFGHSEMEYEGQTEVRQRLQWMEDFERNAVSELEKCTV